MTFYSDSRIMLDARGFSLTLPLGYIKIFFVDFTIFALAIMLLVREPRIRVESGKRPAWSHPSR